MFCENFDSFKKLASYNANTIRKYAYNLIELFYLHLTIEFYFFSLSLFLTLYFNIQIFVVFFFVALEF